MTNKIKNTQIKIKGRISAKRLPRVQLDNYNPYQLDFKKIR